MMRSRITNTSTAMHRYSTSNVTSWNVRKLMPAPLGTEISDSSWSTVPPEFSRCSTTPPEFDRHHEHMLGFAWERLRGHRQIVAGGDDAERCLIEKGGA